MILELFKAQHAFPKLFRFVSDSTLLPVTRQAFFLPQPRFSLILIIHPFSFYNPTVKHLSVTIPSNSHTISQQLGDFSSL
jgi:hypothetical protein